MFDETYKVHIQKQFTLKIHYLYIPQSSKQITKKADNY